MAKLNSDFRGWAKPLPFGFAVGWVNEKEITNNRLGDDVRLYGFARFGLCFYGFDRSSLRAWQITVGSFVFGRSNGHEPA